MDEDQTEYEKMIKLLASLEVKDENEVSSVDISELFGQRGEEKKTTYREAVNSMLSVSSRRSGREAQQAVQMQPKVEAPATMQISMQKSVSYEQPIAQQAKVAAEEISSEVKRLRLKPSHMDVKRIRETDMVLPTLSATDQISELEKIIKGMKMNAFEGDHLEVVIEEVYWLSRIAEKQRFPKQETEANLLNLRNQRLNDAIALIENME